MSRDLARETFKKTVFVNSASISEKTTAALLGFVAQERWDGYVLPEIDPFLYPLSC